MIDFSKDVKIAVASPSYRRPHCITAHYIKDTRIYIDKSDEKAYREANEGFGEIVVCADGIQGNLPRVRNYILDQEFNVNKADIVVMMDDDVESVGLYAPNTQTGFGYERHKLKTLEEFYDFILYGSILCEEWGFGMWGVSHNDDKMLYRHFTPFYTTVPTVGQFMVFTKNELRFDESLPLKEDYDMNLQQCNRYRGALMISFAHVIGDFGKLSGGTAIRRNNEREFQQFKQFKKKWGSKIVRGTNTVGHQVQGESKRYVNHYDFSHPIVRIPIDGV